MRIIDLFAGIGGFSLAAHWMGWETAAFVEWDKDCHRVLQKNFPTVPIYGDIKQFHYEQERDRIGAIDLVCGGFPCQPFSSAGKRNGTADDRYLWPEMLRTIREVGPRWVVGENVAGLITMDGGTVFDEICTSLEAEGYQVEAFVIPACAVGAPHRRDRVWIVGNSISTGCEALREKPERARQKTKQFDWIVAHPEHQQRNWRMVRDGRRLEPSNGCFTLADPNGAGPQVGEQCGTLSEGARSSRPITERDSLITNPASERRNERQGNRGQWSEHWLQAATRLCGKFNGLSDWLDSYKQILIYATTSKTITRQDLRTLREEIQSPEIWENIRRCYQIPKQEFLLTVMRQLEEDSKGQDNIPFDGEAVFENCMRNVQDNGTPGSPSHRRKYNEQRKIKYSNSLSELSHEIALATESLLWRWEAETSDRTRRLKQLGNSIVPQVVYEIFRAIEQVEKTNR